MATMVQESGAPQLESEGLKREVGLLGLMWASEGSIIGSGWLFGSLLALEIAGPAALLAWGIASVIIILLALVHAELGGLFPVSGGTTRFPHYAFGSFAGATFGWFSYIQAATVAPIEVLAVIQYTSTASWASSWYKPPTGTQLNGHLSGAGIVAAVILMAFFVVLNLIGIRWLARFNTWVTSWKVLIPILTIVIFLLFHFHSGNFTAGGGFFMHGPSGGLHSLENAISAGGIVFALLGFEQAVQLGGESVNPQRDLPRAVIGSILIGAAIYILVQLSFIGALDPATILKYKTWSSLGQDTALGSAPFYTVAKVAGLAWLAWILRLDAAISPGGTGLIYLTSSSRISYGLSKNGYVPSAFEKNNQRTAIPVFGVIFATIVGLLFLLPFPSWGSLVTIVTGASVLMYAGAPLALGALRLSKPNLPRAFKLPGGHVIPVLAFALANFVVYWSSWATVSTLMIVLILGYILMFVSYAGGLNPHRPKLDLRAAGWVLPYMVGMSLISYFGQFGGYGAPAGTPGAVMNGIGPFKNFLVGGGGNHLGLNWDLLVLAVFSVAIYGLAMYLRAPSDEVDQYVKDVYPPPAAE
ncbi:MAG TPA: APC family permease [Acidimicrobiales bacterium]|nr:APC family permease [Acidimicrobiales bacterium]